LDRLLRAFVMVFCLISVIGYPQSCPTICVIIPEEDRCIVPRPVPDPACETAIIRAFLSYGFHVVDYQQVKFLRMTDPAIVGRARNGDLAAIRMLSERFAADILVLGEAYAEGTQVPGRFSVQAARSMAEVRVIEAASGRIIAADRVHTGGIDIGSCELAGKRALERAGAELAPRIARAIVQRFSYGCPITIPAIAPPKIGVSPFQAEVRCPSDFLRVLDNAVESEISSRGCRTVQPLASDFVITGAVTDYKEVFTPAIQIPGLEWIWRGVAVWVTVDVQVFDLATAEVSAHEITATVTGVEIFGLRFGASPRDIARAVAKQIASRIGWKCRGR